MSSRRRLATVVLSTTLVLLASATGSHADPGDPSPTPVAAGAEAPEPTPEPTHESTPEPTPEPTPDPTPEAEATPEGPAATPEATPAPSPDPTPAVTPAPPNAAPTPEPEFEAASQPATGPASDVVAGEQSVADSAATAALVPKAFNPVVERLTRADLPYTYRPGCPVGPAGLRRLTVTHLGFDKTYHRGVIIVRASAVDEVKAVFKRALDDRFPIRLMRPVDRYRGSDVRSMEKDNTSAFNCRHVTGNPTRLSQHSYGNAVDVNTRENPYVTGSRVYPDGSRTYLNRANVRKGMLLRSGPVPKAFASRGWRWGARWAHPDYQHFSSNGK